MAVLSSFTQLDFYVALLIIYNVVIFIEYKFILLKKYHFFSLNKVHVIPLLINLAILYEPVRRLTMNSNLDFGGKNGFYSDTAKQLITYICHGLDLSSATWVIAKIIFTCIVFIPFVIIIQMIFRRNESFISKYKGLIISNLLFIFISILLIIQHVIFNLDYPISRFCIFLLPIFIIHFGFFILYLNDKFKRITHIVVLSLAILSSTSFLLKADLRSCSEWGFDMETKNMIIKLTKYHTNNNPDSEKIKMGTNWLFEPTINFYRQTNNINWLIPADRSGISPEDDYFYIFKDELYQLNPENFKILFEFNKTNTLLLKNNNSNSVE